MSKRILFLGASLSQIPPIEYAKSKGYYVITCDYIPENPGHKLANESYNISTTDQYAVLKLAEKLKIDGIVAYASDPAAPTAAYVAEKLGLPGNPYDSVLTLARKDLFRDFLKDNNFINPRTKSFYELESAALWVNSLNFPVFVKPVDSSGSKGVTEISNKDELECAFNYALKYSREKKVIIEEKIIKEGYQFGSDIFVVDGVLKFWLWGNQHHNMNCSQYVPIAMSYPTILDKGIQIKAASLVNSILERLKCKSGAFNIEFLVDKFGEVWILEVGPRNGGNLIPEVIKYATGIDLIKATVDSALGLDCSYIQQAEVNGCWSYYAIHSVKDGILDHIKYSVRLKSMIRAEKIYTQKGDMVRKYNGSNDTLGLLILEYPDVTTMLKMLDNMEEDVDVIMQ